MQSGFVKQLRSIRIAQARSLLPPNPSLRAYSTLTPQRRSMSPAHEHTTASLVEAAASAVKANPHSEAALHPWSKADRVFNSDTYVRFEAMPSPSASSIHAAPGFDSDAAEVARDLLQYNHETFHVYFNESSFHNHLSHHLLASLSLGAPETYIPIIYTHSLTALSPSWKWNKKPSRGDKGDKEPITRANFKQHLTRVEAYWGYLDFFEQELKQHGTAKVLEEWVFSDEANEEGVAMLARSFGGILHPLIHFGYGIEFAVPGLVAEGLAMACVTRGNWASQFPKGWAEQLPSGSSNSSSSATSTASEPHAGHSIFSITTLMGLDEAFAPDKAVKHSDAPKSPKILDGEAGRLIREKYAQMWHITEADVQDLDPSTGRGGWWGKLEELIWFNALLIGATSKPGKAKQHDFFLVHTHNATLFLPSILPLLKPRSRAMLLQAHLRASLVFWVAQGRPAFEIEKTLNAGPKSLDVDGDVMGDDGKCLVQQEGWNAVSTVGAHHLDEHTCKAVRALAWFAVRLSTTPPGALTLQPDATKALEEAASNSGKSIEELSVWRGLEKLDGTAFIRSAVQLFESQGMQSVPNKDGEFDNLWNYKGPGFDETWTEEK